MGLVAYKGVLYGGGSEVIPNPQDSATDTMTKVGIDGTVYEVTDADAVHTSDIGTANGVAELDANGLVPSSQLPSYVDDVLEYASVSAFPATGETGKIYVALDTNLTYRWSGSVYVEISPSLALGETSSTAYRGDRGKTAYDHATESGKISQAVSSGLYKVGVTAQGHIASTTPVAKSDLTALGLADQNDVDAIEEDIEGYKTVTGEYITISDGAALPAKALSITLSPVQDLNGYEFPWVGGAGKNKLGITVAEVKANGGTWSGNSVTLYGVTFTLNSKDGVYVDSISATGTASGNHATLWLKRNSSFEFANQMILSGAIDSYCYVRLTDSNNTNYNAQPTEVAVPAGTYASVFVSVMEKNTVNGTFYPMIRLATVTDSTFAPYSNLCPIHGTDEVWVNVCGINQWDEEWEVGSIDNQGQNVVWSQEIRSKNYTECIPNTEYFNKKSQYPSIFYFYDSDKSFISYTMVGINTAFTTPSNAKFFRFRCLDEYGNTYNHDISINYPSTDTTYHAYNGNSETLTLPTTVYGGTVDVTGGSGTETIGYAEFDGSSDEAWTLQSINSYGIANFYIIVPNMAVQATDFAITNYLKRQNTLISQTTEMGFLLSSSGQATSGVLYVRLDQNLASTAAELKTYLANHPLQICFTEITPTDLSTTPASISLLEGINNVWSECSENNVVVGNAQQSLSYQPQNIVGQLRQEIEAKPDSFAQLSDTSFSNLANGQIPKWNSTSQKWENANESGGGGASSLAELSDTNISSPADGQILKYDNATSKWVNAAEYSYTLPTASASTKGGIKVGDNLAMNGEVLSAKLPQWEKVWNYKSGTTFTMPTGKTDILLVVVSTLTVTRLTSAFYPVEYPFPYILAVEYTLADGAVGLDINRSNLAHPWIDSTQYSLSDFDFEIWVR